MPSFQFRLPIRDDLTNLQKIAIDDDSAIFLTGVPGSGKTVVAIYRVVRLNNTSKLFTYTRMLTVAIKNSTNMLQRDAATKVSSIYEWFWEKCSTLLSEIIHDEEKITNCLRTNNINFEELIFDESQDLPIYLYNSLSKFCNKISLGADDAQLVFENGCTEKELSNVFNKHHPHELDQNHRNTYEIFNFASNIITENERAQNPNMLERLKRKRRGDKPLLILHRNNQDIKETFKQIIIDNIGGNIGILLAHRDNVKSYYNFINNDISILINPKNRLDCSYYYNKMPRDERNAVENDLKNILITTFKSAKGMEFDTVIIPEFQMIDNELKKQFFVGCTRARSNLFLFCKEGLPSLINKSSFNDTYTLQDNRSNLNTSSVEDDLPF